MSGCKCTPHANWVLIDGTPYNMGTILKGGSNPQGGNPEILFAGDSQLFGGHDIPDAQESFSLYVNQYLTGFEAMKQMAVVGGAGPNDWMKQLQVAPSKPSRTQEQQAYKDWYDRQPFWIQLFSDNPV